MPCLELFSRLSVCGGSLRDVLAHVCRVSLSLMSRAIASHWLVAAPPPLNVELVRVFACVCRKNATKSRPESLVRGSPGVF